MSPADVSVDLDTLNGYASRRLLAAVSRWAREQGWERSLVRNLRLSPDGSLSVAWDADGVDVHQGDGRGGVALVCHLRPATVREAVDVLAALDVVPQYFSRQYAAGRASRVVDNWLTEVSAS